VHATGINASLASQDHTSKQSAVAGEGDLSGLSFILRPCAVTPHLFDAVRRSTELLIPVQKATSPFARKSFSLRFDSLKKPVTGFEPATY
jgi:hypothetical protein